MEKLSTNSLNERANVLKWSGICDGFPSGEISIDAIALSHIHGDHTGGLDQIVQRGTSLREWTNRLAEELKGLGARVYSTETYFFFADFASHDASEMAIRLRQNDIFIKRLNDVSLGPGFMHMTTALPADNRRLINVLKEILQHSQGKVL